MGTPKRERKKANRQQKIEEQRRIAQRAGLRRRIIVFTVAALALLAVLYVYSISGNDNNDVAADVTTTTTSVADVATTAADNVPAAVEPVCPADDGSSPRTLQFTASPPMCIDPAVSYQATVSTSMGDFVIALDSARAPETVNNFVFLARYHYYDGDDFHRVIPGFVIQGGDPIGNPPGTGGPGYTIADELPDAGAYELGSVAMANTSAPDTGGSQFFVITGDQGINLPPQYALFGQVVEGLDVPLAIQDVPTGPGDAPIDPVVINSITISEA